MIAVFSLLTLINAYILRGYVENFGVQDIESTSIRLRDLATHSTIVEPPTSGGNFTFRDLVDGEYAITLVSSTLNDSAIYRVSIAQSELQVVRTQGVKEQTVGYPIALRADRIVYREPRRPRLSDIYTDKVVLVTVGVMVLFNILPKMWQDMSAEDLAVLEKQEGFQSAFETAHKLASGAANS